MNNLFIITRTVWIEYFRRKDFYVVLILTGLFALIAMAARGIGIETAAEAEFLMSFGLTLAYLLSGALTILLASRQLPREFENKTLYPLLARPVTRSTFLAGKIFGVAALGAMTLILLTLLAWLPTPKSVEQNGWMLVQNLGLQSISLLLLAVFTCAISLFMPPVVAMLIALALFLLGGTVLQVLMFNFGNAAPMLGLPSRHVLSLVPDFSVFEHTTRFVQGQPPLSAGSLLQLLAYGLLLSALYYAAAAWSLGRRTL